MKDVIKKKNKSEIISANAALMLGGVGSLGSIDAYISAVNRLPMLASEEEVSLASAYQKKSDLTAAQKLVLSHLRLVVSIARGYLGYGLPHADLIQEGNIGLMKAVKRFDPDKGVRLVSYAMHWIKAEIHEYILKNWRLIKIATTKGQRKLFFNLRSNKEGLDSLTEAQISALAKKLNVKTEEVMEMETRFSGRDISLEGNSDDEESSFSPINYLSAEHSGPLHALETKEFDYLQTEGLEAALSSLKDRAREIIEARWLVDDDSSIATLQELGDRFGISAERVRQIELDSLTMMKKKLISYQ